jgi:cellulose biosynthesis protein BcsQ
LPGTVNARGIFKSIMNMDYIFTPIIPDRMAMQSSMSFVAAVQDFLSANPNVPLRGIHVFWNKVNQHVPAGILNIYNKIMGQLQLNIMETNVPDTNRYEKELSLSGKPFFRCTLFPPTAKMLKGSNLDKLSEEIGKIIEL